MANTSPKTSHLEPIMLLKIGIPLALSAAGGIMMAKGPFPPSFNFFKPKSKLTKNENFHTQNHSSPLSLEEEALSVTEGQNPNVEEVLLTLKSRVEDLERRELGIERQFILYQNLKERESLLVELRNTLVLDMAQIKFLESEILLMGEENKRFESLVSEYLGVSEQLEGQKTDNKLLEREVKRLKKRLKEQSKMIKEKNLKIEDWRNNEEMETKKKMIEKLGNEVKELKVQMDQLQKEEEEENKASTQFKSEAEKTVTIEDFNKLSNEFNELKEAFEVLRNHEQTQQGQKENQKDLDQDESSTDKTNSTRPNLLQRISCVGGTEKMKRKIRPE